MRLTPADFRADLSECDLKELQSDPASAILIKPPHGSEWDFVLCFAAGARPYWAAGEWVELTPKQATLFALSRRLRRLDVAPVSISFGEDSGIEYQLVEQPDSGSGI